MSKGGPSRPVGAIKHPLIANGYDAVFLRFLDQEDEGRWVILEPRGGLKYLGSRSNIKLPWHLNQDDSHVGRLFNACALGIAGDDGLIITVGSYNAGLCMDIRDLYNNARFKLNSEIKLIFDTPFAVIKETIQREMALPDSDAPTPKGKFFLLSELNHLGVSQTFNDVTDPLTCRRYLWNMVLIRYFQPFIPTEFRHYTCVRDWSMAVGEMYHFWGDQGLAHDKIEAINLLFNWA